MKIRQIIHTCAIVIVCLAIGAVGSIVLLFSAAFIFAGAEGDSWVRSFFGEEGFFLVSTILLGVIAYPFIKKANLKLV